MGLESYFGIKCGVEIVLSRINCQISLGWRVLKM